MLLDAAGHGRVRESRAATAAARPPRPAESESLSTPGGRPKEVASAAG